MDGVSRLLSLFSTTSMPLRRARPTTLVALPTSMPSTLMAVSGRSVRGNAFRDASRSGEKCAAAGRNFTQSVRLLAKPHSPCRSAACVAHASRMAAS